MSPDDARDVGLADMTRPNTPLRIGPVERHHRARLAEILSRTKVFRREEVDVALELFDESLSDPDYLFLGAFTPENELVGYACYGPTPGTDRTWDLYWIAIDPSMQGTGGGTTLLSEVERRLRELDARMLVVETSSRPDYEATRAFYTRRGYDEAARVGNFYAPDDDRIIYTKRLTTTSRSGSHGVASSTVPVEPTSVGGEQTHE
jgi:ribosomal protein S18 acetylase RimI-like enzyme